MVEVTFVNAQYLWLLFIIPFLILTHFYGLRFSRKKAMRFANLEALARVSGGRKLSMNLPLLFLRFFTLLFLIFALSQPIFWYIGEGSDFNFLIAIDSSGSMLADDFPPNRLEAAKTAAKEFINTVPKDAKVGLMSFSGTQFIKQVMTEDFEAVELAIDGVNVEYSSGTAVGDAIIAGSNMIISEEKGRVIVLLTDGQSNAGTVLEKAINYANDNFITVYTIGMATAEGGRFQGIEALSTIDDSSLEMIAKNTGGAFYRAVNTNELIEAYREIAQTSKKKVPIRLAIWFTILAFLALTSEWVIVNTKFRSVP
ncbi:VWA domain-containing protein [Candidatus Woesearchaeota archaeon]|nr:VWA domain-containing protein [Candidatus Woesearchaeota archaeon]